MYKGTIIYTGNFELPDKNAAAHRVMNNGKIFKDLGYRVVYLGTVRDESFEGVRQFDYCEDIFEEAYPTGTKQWVNHIFDTTNIQRVAANFTDTCLVIAYNVPFATYKALKNAFVNKHIKVAYDCTEWNDYAEGNIVKRLYKKYDEKQIRTKLSRICNDIIVISKLMEKQYGNRNLLKLPPLVDLKDSIWQQEREVHEGVFEFCFAGTTSNKESLNKIVECFGKLDNSGLRLRIIGQTKEEYLAVYPQHEELLENDCRIVFGGYVSHEEAVKQVLSCDCYIFIREKTRRNDAGFPTKFAEAFTCGVPIISTNVSDIKAFADDGVILIDDTGEEAILSAMKQAIYNGSKERSVKNTFDYSNYLNETKQWLLKIYD